MCGRFSLAASAEQLLEFFPLFEMPAWTPRYNIAPTQPVLALRHDADAKPNAALLRWGLIPSWAEDKKIGARLINARADTVATKPSFRAAFKRRRCLIVADGFYEWKKKDVPKKGPKQPYHIRMTDAHPFAFAGLWERWEGRETPIESCTIITTDANAVVEPIHDRMPVILEPRDYRRWLDPDPKDPAELQEMLRPFVPEKMTAIPVGEYINNARHEGPCPPGTTLDFEAGSP